MKKKRSEVERTFLDRVRIGDKVEFELCRTGDNRRGEFPRWDQNQDRGGSGEWWPGEVIGRSDTGAVHILYKNPRNGRVEHWAFPASGFGRARDGWVRELHEVRCECGSWKVYGRRGPHSDWCPASSENLNIFS